MLRPWAAASARATVIALSLLCAGLEACRKPDSETRAAPALSVRTAEVTARPIPRVVSTDGTVIAWQELPVGAETSGFAVVSLGVDEGDRVVRGQPLAQLNDRVLRAQLAQQEASVAEAHATLVEARANLVRAEELRRNDATSAQNLDARRATAATAAARLSVSEAARTETAARLAQTTIVAPADGYVSSRSVVIGQVVMSGQELFRIVHDGRLELDAEVPETDLTLLREGQVARVSADGAGDVAATVRAIAPRVDPRTRLGIVHLALPADSGFRPGMFARATIVLGDAAALVVPQAAVIWRDGRAGAFVIDAGSKASFRPVETGARFGAQVEIRSGLEAGERVAVDGAGFLEDGDRVRVADDDAQDKRLPTPAVGVVGG
jgi:RND family efflux transporter MFP subunit